jgi:hypothetical protein
MQMDGAPMPTVFHSMRLDANDGMPLRGQSATTLGIRQGDFDIDPVTTMVTKNGKGTSVSPSCGQLPQSLRLRKFAGGLGGKNLFCFKLGTGTWQAGIVAPGLDLFPDPNDPDHGFLTPEVPMLHKDLEDAMEATRPHWQIV